MDLFVIPEQDKRAIRKIFDITDEELAEKISKLQEWSKKNPRLPLKSQDEHFQEMVLLRNKFDLERTKSAIEKYFECILRHREVFEKCKTITKPSEEMSVVVACPRLTDKYERIGVMKLSNKAANPDNVDVDRCILTAATLGLLMFNIDYVAGLRVILDFDNLTLQHVLKVTPAALLKLLNIHENVLKVRLAGIEILHAPGILNAVLKLAKLVLKPKLFARITVHSDYDSLHENVSKECLPSDYGGHLESISDLGRLVDEAVAANQHIYDEITKLIEMSDKFNDQNNIQGTFKMLTID